MRKPKLVYPEGYKPPKAVAAMVRVFRDTVMDIFADEGVPIAEIQFESPQDNNDSERYAAFATKDGQKNAFLTNIRTAVGAIRDGVDLEGVTRHEIRHILRRDPECYYALSDLVSAAGLCKELTEAYANERAVRRKNRFESAVLQVYGTPESFLTALKKMDTALSGVSKQWDIFSATDTEMKTRFATEPDFQDKLADLLLSANQQVSPKLIKLTQLKKLVDSGGPKVTRKLTPAQWPAMDAALKIMEQLGADHGRWKEFERVYRHAAEYECDRYAQETEHSQGSMMNFLHIIEHSEEKIKGRVPAVVQEDNLPAVEQEDTHPETSHRIAALKRQARQAGRSR